MHNKHEYTECDSCAAKAGSPTLCNGCYINRCAISELKEEVKKLDQILKILHGVISLSK